MRTVHFIGIETLFHLMIGTYHRPVLEEKVLLFLDINNSTGLAEQGDTKRAIGVYGSTINIAARMEEAAKVHNVACAVSGDVAQALADGEPQLRPLGDEQVKGISVEIPIFEYRVDDETRRRMSDPARARARAPLSA
jgi:hypothetical protein